MLINKAGSIASAMLSGAIATLGIGAAGMSNALSRAGSSVGGALKDKKIGNKLIEGEQKLGSKLKESGQKFGEKWKKLNERMMK